MKHTLIVIKTELTLNGVNLDSDARSWYPLNRNPEVVRHYTILHQQECKTAKAAWAAATPELLDQFGLVHNGIGGYSTDYAGYSVNVVRSDRLSEVGNAFV